MENIIFMAIVALVAILVVGVFGFIVARLYKRASKETAFVRTGAGGQKVVKDGGALIIPVLHDTLDINMQTLKLEVSRTGQDALITHDRMRTDVTATFFVRVKPDNDAIAQAAQTLGRRTQNPDLLKAVIEDKFIDALRSVASSMELKDLHEKRSDFVQKVKTTVEEDLKTNGLELESVSLTRLDQTDQKFLNPNNAFDAEGLTNLAKITQEKARERNEIEQTARVAIEKRNFEANQESLAIRQSDEFARLDQERQVETRKAEQEAQLAQQRADRKREADVAAIEAEKQTELARTTSNQETALARTEANKRQKEAEITANQQLRIAEQNQQIALNAKSEEESKSRAIADAERANAVAAAESVKTAEAVATAERLKRVAIIEAEQEAGRKATEITVQAKAEFEASDLRTKARLKDAEARERELTVEAEGKFKINEAENSLSPEQIALRLRTTVVQALPGILEQMVAPMKAIKDARIVTINGTGVGGAVAGGTTGSNTTSVPEQLTNSLLNYRSQAPLADALGKLVGMNLNGSLNDIIPDDLLSGEDGLLAPVAAVAQVADTKTNTVQKEDQELKNIQHLAGIDTKK